MNSSIIAAE